MNMRIERIELNRVDEFLSIIREIAVWLKENGKEMWNLERIEKEHFLKRFKDGEWYICYCDEEAAGAFILLSENEFWWPDIPSNETLFLKKLGVRTKYAGKGVSIFIMEWIKNEVRKRNMQYIRLEIFADVKALDTFYKRHGFKLVKEAPSPKNNKLIGLYECRVR